MRAFWATTKLTCKSALRSHIFQFLLVLLILCIFIIPNTISGDGTLSGYVRIALKYNLGMISFVLSLSTIWLSCFSLTRDVESYEIHMVISKPVSRVTVWLGKCAGVILMNLILLAISSMIVYVFMLYQLNKMQLSAYEKNLYEEGVRKLKAETKPADISEFRRISKKKRDISRLENEVLVGRRVFYPELPDFTEEAKKEYAKRIESDDMKLRQGMSSDPEKKKKYIMEIRRQLRASYAGVSYGKQKSWTFIGLPVDLKTPMYFRYRTYVGKVSSKDQTFTRGIWFFKAYDKRKSAKKTDSAKDAKSEMTSFMLSKTPGPEQIMCGIFHEFPLPPEAVSPVGEADISFRNFDPDKKNLFFQIPDGPKLLVKVSGFFQNYCRAVLMILLQLVILAGVSCAAGSFLSLPTAIFLVVSYLLFGIFADFLLGSDVPAEEFADILAVWVSRVLMLIIIPMQKFEVSKLVASGELIEFSYILSVFLKYFVLRGLPIFLLGIWLYRRREMGMVVRK